MYTRCPECQTLFSLTEAQRAARGGLVRCGRCSTVFQCNNALTDKLPVDGEPAAAKDAAGVRTRPRLTGDTDIEFPLLNAARRPRTRLPFWILGNLLLMLTLVAQFVYFYGATLARTYPPLDQTVVNACRWLGCSIKPRQNIGLIDLVQARVSPHPKFDNALRVTATLVNRAGYLQPYPLLEVTLSDSGGGVLARRAFQPAEYLDKTHIGSGMPPHVAIRVSFDVTSPDRRAVGYEIQLFAAP